MQTVNFIAFLVFFALFLIVLFIGVIAYELGSRRRSLSSEGKDDWLFYKFSERMYEIFFSGKDEDEVAASLGIKVDQYLRNCDITKTKPDVHGVIINFLYSIILGFLCIVMALFTTILFVPAGLGIFFTLLYYKQIKMNKEAEEKRLKITEELPRFLDLLQSELQAGLEPEQAIYLLCSKLGDDMLLAGEFRDAFSSMHIGAERWDEAISKTAEKYDVDLLSDFVMNIVTAYRRGVPITELVVRLNKDIKQSYVLSMRERSDKMTNTILIPITLLQFMPMLVFTMFPALYEVFTSLR